MDRDLMDHGAFSSGASINGIARDVGDVDLSDHGAIAYDNGLSGTARDVGDVDLSDHGAVSYDNSLSGTARDVGDVDLSDHGAISYAPMKETWGTNDIDIAKQMDMLMHASSCSTIDKVIPLLNGESLAKVIEYRYRKVANVLDINKYGLGRDDKVGLGIDMNMDLAIIGSAIALNPKSFEQIFNPSLYAGEEKLTDIFGVLESYQGALDQVDVLIPLINGATGEPIVDANGKEVNAQDLIAYLMSKKELMQNQQVMSVSGEPVILTHPNGSSEVGGLINIPENSTGMPVNVAPMNNELIQNIVADKLNQESGGMKL